MESIKKVNGKNSIQDGGKQMNEDSLSDVDPGNPLPGISVANITLLQCRQLFL